MPASFDGLTCPRCGAGSLATEEGHRYCSYIGGDTDAPCSWGLGKHDRGSREADRAEWRKKRGIPEPCPANHPAACYGRLEQVLAEEPIDGCRWCQTEEWRRKAEGEATRLGNERSALRDTLAEQSTLLALYSGGKAGKVPGGWTVTIGRDPAFTLMDRGQRRRVYVYADGRIERFDFKAATEESDPGPRPVLTACAEAERWLAERGGA